MTDQIKTGLYGLVICGGMSSRMGTDKSMLVYHSEPQYIYLYKMLLTLCEKVFISCNDSQANKMEPGYPTIIDLPAYKGTGPMAALLTAFTVHKGKDFLIIGCDYPFLKSTDLQYFLNSFQRKQTVAAFYNSNAELFEPLLAYYNRQSSEHIFNMHVRNEYSLQHFLQNNLALKFYPENLKSIVSIDTEADYLEALNAIQRKTE